MNKKELTSQLQIEVKPLEEKDIDLFDPILRQHVRDRDTGKILEDEIIEIKEFMRGASDKYGRTRKYLVAKSSTGQIIGCMAYSVMDSDMIKHFSDLPFSETAELLNAFVDSEVFRGGGVGRKLFESICQTAKSEGKKYLAINSGPRYKESWGFYEHVCDENRGMIVEKYGPGGDANTWIKRL